MTGNWIPSETECLTILKKYSVPNNVIEHCLLVKKIAEDLCDQIPSLNRKLVIAGAILHDIGRCVTHSIKHGIEGVKILKKEKVDPRIIAIVKKHIGTGITLEEARKLGLPPDDYIPSTPEEIVVSYADNLACGSKKCTFNEVLAHFKEKFGENSTVVRGFLKQRDFIERMIKENKR